MMGSGFGDAIVRGLIAVFVIGIGVAFALGLLAMWGVPKLWAWLKPLIHAMTS